MRPSCWRAAQINSTAPSISRAASCNNHERCRPCFVFCFSREWASLDRAREEGRRAYALGTLCACLLALSPSAYALNPALDVNQYAHTAWKIREGFSKGVINTIAQTPDGYLWLGTDSGLLRFDGVRNVVWQPPSDQPLPSNHVTRLLVARDGTLWIATPNGLASWKDGTLSRYLAGESVLPLIEDREGTVWAGVRALGNGRLCSIQKGSVRCYGGNGRF